MTNPGFPPGRGGPGHRSRRRRCHQTCCAGCPQYCRLAGSCPTGSLGTGRPRLQHKVGMSLCALLQKLRYAACSTPQRQMVPPLPVGKADMTLQTYVISRGVLRTQDAYCKDASHDAKDAPARQATAATAAAAARPGISGRGGSPRVGRAATCIVMCPATALRSDTALSHENHPVGSHDATKQDSGLQRGIRCRMYGTEGVKGGRSYGPVISCDHPKKATGTGQCRLQASPGRWGWGPGPRRLAGGEPVAHGGAGGAAVPAGLDLAVAGAPVAASSGAHVALLKALHHAVAALCQPPHHLHPTETTAEIYTLSPSSWLHSSQALRTAI